MGNTKLFMADGAMRTLVEKQAGLRNGKATALQSMMRKRAAQRETQVPPCAPAPPPAS